MEAYLYMLRLNGGGIVDWGLCLIWWWILCHSPCFLYGKG